MSRNGTPLLPLSNGPSRSSPAPRAQHSEPSSRKSSSKPQARRGSRTAQSITSSYAILTADEAAQRLSTSHTNGLSPAEAETRLHEHGANELPHEEPEPLWLRYIKQFKETLILLLLGSAAVSFLMGKLEDAISITCAVFIVCTVAFIQEYRSEKSLEALNRLVPHYAHLIRSNSERGGGVGEVDESKPPSVGQLEAKSKKLSNTVPASSLVPGDLILFYTGDRVPADVRITLAVDLTIDESNLTGENEPVHKMTERLNKEEIHADDNQSPLYSTLGGNGGSDIRLNEQTNIAFMGTLVRSGYGQGLVVGTGGDTEFGAVSASLQEIEAPRTPLQQSMDSLGKELSYMSFGIIAFIMLVGLWRGWKPLDMFQIGVSLAVAAIPEGLPIIVTVTLALGVFRMSKRGAIVRRLPSVETLGSVNVICSDKTGTLTMNHMTITKLWHGDKNSPVDVQQLQKEETLDKATRTILRIGNIANNGRLADGSSGSSSNNTVLASTMGDETSSTKTRWLGQPTDVAIMDLLDLLGEHDVRENIGDRQQETAFSSERKWMGVAIPAKSTDGSGGSAVGYIKGAIEQVLRRCDTYLTKDGREVVLDEANRKKARDAAESMAGEGLRVLAFASGSLVSSNKTTPRSRTGTPVNNKSTAGKGSKDEDPYQGLAFAGLVGMSDPPRKGVDKSIRKLMAGGVKVIMITGDAETTAVAISKKLGMPVNMNSAVGKAVIRGDELDRMSEEELSQAIATTTIFARTSPEHKMKIIRALQARGDVVAMTGDGVNDAPALKKADIGVAMGRLGTDVAKEAADMILTDDDFSTILSAIEEGKGIFSNIQNFLTFQLSTSAAALSLVLFSTFLGFQNPLNAMQILWINILMDGPPAQSLGVEPVDPAVMKRPPRAKNARVLTRHLLQRVLQSASVIMLGTLLTYIHEMSMDGEVTARDTTMTFTCFVLFDMFNALTCRSQNKSVLRGEVGLFSNKMFNYAVAGSLVGQAAVVYLPVAQRIFQTEALGFGDVLRLLCIASTVFWVDEGRKFMVRRKTGRGLPGGYSESV